MPRRGSYPAPRAARPPAPQPSASKPARCALLCRPLSRRRLTQPCSGDRRLPELWCGGARGRPEPAGEDGHRGVAAREPRAPRVRARLRCRRVCVAARGSLGDAQKRIKTGATSQEKIISPSSKSMGSWFWTEPS
ncbi:unnamed protein product [Rangifer tarandus platyrhynchus]|uniref:Uncharacterized protein n=1 Tax=Rangifer tarandus platyrhynchus TaxID=3082113 RepID=A0AC59ZQI6_RANTA